MYRYKLWIRIDSLSTADAYIYADNDAQAKMIAEAQYGVGNVLNYTRVN
jgi:hypothetical protein